MDIARLIGRGLENLSTWEARVTIRDQGKLYTACGDGKIPFIGALDIAAMAFHGLTDEKPHNTDYMVLGPELLTYDEVYRRLNPQTQLYVDADGLHADCGKIQQRSRPRDRARQTL